MNGVRVTRMGWAPRAWLARFRLEPDGGATHITERALYALQPLIRDHLTSPFPFHIKVLLALHIEKLDPATSEMITNTFMQNVVPWRSSQSDTPDLRMHQIVAAMRWKYETARERASLPGSGWSIVGIWWMDVLVAPGLQNVPAPGVGGGCRVELPESLTNQKGLWNPQVRSKCFQWCLRAAFLDIGSYDNLDRLHTNRCAGPPFYAQSRGRGRPRADAPPRQLVDVGLDFSAVDMDVVPIEAIRDFELSNLGAVEVVVYQWVEKVQRKERLVGETLLRAPPDEVIQARRDGTRVVALLLHQNHYILIHNFNAFAGQQGEQVGLRWRKTSRLHLCPICTQNFKSELALRTHFKNGQCRADFEGRKSQISMPSPQASALRYRTTLSCELSPVMVYADFEVFSNECEGGAAILGCQNRVAAVGYAAVGMCGYEPPDEHKLRMIHAQPGDDESAVVLKFLASMMNLADHFEDWRMLGKKRLVWNPEQKSEHKKARVCRECRRAFDSKKEGCGKVAHHEHGTGAFLGSLCQDCNKAAHKPSHVTICFHNGGRYDFHFLLRAFAKLRHVTPKTSNDRESGSSRVGCRSGKIRKFGIKELAARVQGVRLQGLVDSLSGDVVKRLRKFKVSILQKSGETNLVMRFGVLRFIDTMNFCKAGLGGLIESHRRSALKTVSLGGRSEVLALERAFPLTASRHPFLKSAGDGVWSALLRKLPMPWDYFVGCGDFEKPPVWSLACYHSRLSGDCAEADYKLLQRTSDFMGFSCFKEVFDTYLALDITAFADLMQIFRQHFFETHHLDPFLYPSLPSAAWDAALRSVAQQGGRSFRLITNLDVYKDVKKAMMGGLCAVFKPHSGANFEGMEGYNEHIPAKRIMDLDVNSMYPHAMTKHLPCSSGKAVTLPEAEDEKLKWLHDMLDSFDPLEDCWQTVYLVFVDYDFPEDLHDGIDFPPPCRMAVPAEEVGPYTKDAVRARRPTEKLVPYLGLHEREGIHIKRLAFLRNRLGARIWKVHRAYSFDTWPVLKSFMNQSYAYRRQLKEEGKDTEQGFVKLTVNSIYGKTVQNQERYRNSTHYFDPVSFSRAQVDRSVADFDTEIFERYAFLGTVHRVRPAKRNVNRSPIQVGWGVLEQAKLDLCVQYWMIKITLPRVVPLLTDTDSLILEVIGNVDPIPLLAQANLDLPVEFDLIGDADVAKFELVYGAVISKDAMDKLKSLRGKLGALCDECSKWDILSVVSLAVKKYSVLLTENKQIQKAKGVARRVRDSTKHDEYLRIHREHAVRCDKSVQLRSVHHQVLITQEEKKTYGVMNDKAFQLTREYCRPLGHWRNAYTGLWMKIEGRKPIFDNIMEFVRGPVPAMREDWGKLVRDLLKKTRGRI